MDVNSLFSRAEQAFLAGRLDDSRRDIVQVQRLVGDNSAVLHLLALVEKKRGALDDSRQAFVRALKLAPADPQINNNYGNLLESLGALDEALGHFERALRASPGFAEARYNRARLLKRIGRMDEALAELDQLAAASPKTAKFQSARGALLRQLGRTHEAADAFDSALRIDPARLPALHGRGRVAMERGEAGASAFYARALEQKPDDLELVLGFSEALEAEGDPRAQQVLTEAVERHPEWTVGHEVLARMRSESGEPDAFADHYRSSLEKRPGDRGLHYSYWSSLARGERHAEALEALRAAKRLIAEDVDMRLMEAIFTSEAGDPAAALRLLDQLPGNSDRQSATFARGRIALRAGDAIQAAALFEQMTSADPGLVSSWAHLDLAWRMTGDQRHEWLSGQPGLFGVRDVGLSAAELDSLAQLLRRLHVTRSHPIGQSLRGGTQTRGRLFWRSAPELVRIHEAILSAVRGHMAALPPRDDTHPLLRHRSASVTIEGSWSVRLTSEGFHVNHIHPEGVLSSACYVSLPATMGSNETRDGWLELGRPPVELGLSLEPLESIEPRPGRLALFPSYLFHGTRPFTQGERLTIAFDVAAR